jgi:hypothetical protein
MTTRLTAPAERCRDGLTWVGYRECWVNLGEQVFDREQTPIRNVAVDRDQMVCRRGGGMNVFANRVMAIIRKGPFRARGRCEYVAVGRRVKGMVGW